MNFKLKLERIHILLMTNTGSQFERNFVKVAKASVSALALPTLATPLLSGLFAPKSLAILAVFVRPNSSILIVSD